MALIFDNIADTPQLHAFVIGVGAYRHMLDGSDPKPQGLESIGLLRQLTSPPKSAIAFQDLLIAQKDQWKVPLGSIEFLLSPAPSEPDPDGQGTAFEAATIQNIKNAFNSWHSRCNTSEDNIALFYFCGHGVEKAGQYLLAEDFGANGLNPWEGSFSFDSTRLAFHKVKAKTQLFFIDACRKITSQMLQFNLPELPLMIPGLSPECEYNLTIKASARNDKAMGPKNDISYFTQALIKVFEKGALAERGPNQSWIVKSGQISAGINGVLKRIKNSEDFKQRCMIEISDSTELFKMNKTPHVDVRIAIDEQAEAFYQKVPDGQQKHRENNLNPWEFNVEAGIYNVGAKLNDGNDRSEQRLLIFDPPSFEDSIQIGQP